MMAVEQQQQERHAYRLVGKWRESYAIACLPSKEQQARRLEALRYKYGHYKDAPEAAMMRTIRVVTKRYLPFLYAARAFRGFF